MMREVTVKQFVADLMLRLETAKTIDCCKAEIKQFAELAAKKMPDEKITVEWKDA